ncbi:MAG: hypothetical protein WAU32_07585, partial [Thermoanaerobaculia bacterium]
MTGGQRWVRSAAAALFLAAGCATAGHRASTPGDAAPRGHLLIVGGGPIPGAILERFVELAGGRGRARIIIFPMASENADAGLELAEDFRRLGAETERIVLTREEATETAARRLGGVTGIWFGGGDQARLTAVLLQTPVEAAIRARY